MLYLENPLGSFAPWTGEAIDGVQHPAWRKYETTWIKSQLNAIGLHRSADIAPADPIPEGKISTGQTVQRVGGVVKFVHALANAPEPTLQERRDILIPRIEQMRWDKEVGGMTFGGVPIPTDDRAKTLIMGARTAAVEQGEAYSDEWKISPGVYVPLDAAAAIALGDALLAHIRACFAREKALIQAVLDANTHAAMDEAEDEIETGWPE